jgi:hypothetical protein
LMVVLLVWLVEHEGDNAARQTKVSKLKEAMHAFIWTELCQPCRAETMPSPLLRRQPRYNANSQVYLIWMGQWGR